MSEPEGKPVLIGTQWQQLRGHAYGLRGPVLLGTMRWKNDARFDAQALAAILCEQAGTEPADAQACVEGGVTISTFFTAMHLLERGSQSPVNQCGVVLATGPAEGGSVTHTIALQTFAPPLTQALANWLAQVIGMCDLDAPTDPRGESAKAVHAALQEARSKFRLNMKRLGVNPARIARACGELGLPVQWLPRGYLHVGSGPNARLFKSTLTEATPALGTEMARSKSATAAMLALRGLPVPVHKVVASAQEAVQAAHALGYPVVVKPDDRDGGQGVHAGLKSDDEVRQCYEQTAAVSPNVLVETHIDGQDFRITVDNGQVVKAIGRQPGGVLGDGTRTVEELVDAAIAAKPALRGSASLVSIDAEALEILAARGMTVRSVPAEGDFIALRRRANMSTGGTSRDALATLHPDNARLAIRAAQALRLDLAGVDLIIPDISVSWMDCKAAICEVNAQPQISTEFAPEVYRDILRRMVPEPSRMRAVLLLDARATPDSDASVVAAAAKLTQEGERVLSVRSTGTWLGDERLSAGGRNVFPAAVAAELECEATAAVCALTPHQLLRHGLPWLHIDQLQVLRDPGVPDSAQLNACFALVARHTRAME